jgi:cerevisin
VAVKVLSDTGGGAASDIVSGVDWSFGQFQSSGNPSVAIMSLGGRLGIDALDAAVTNVSLKRSHVLYGVFLTA